MGISAEVQQVIFVAFLITWLGGEAVLYFRFRVSRNAYLRRFEREIDFFAGDPIFYPGSVRAYREVVRIMRERQTNAELEQLRLQMWRHYRYCMTWIFGFPFIVVGAVALLILTGLVHLY